MTFRTSTPTAPVAPPPAEIQERRTLLEPTIFSVAANSLRAVFAGLGLALIVACVLWWLRFQGWDVGVHFLRTWGIASGILLFVLHSSDRIAFVLSQWQLHGARVDLDAAEAEIERLETENKTVIAENSFLRFKYEEVTSNRNFIPAVGVESQAYQDARALINEWGKTKKHPSRRSVNLSDDRHKAAMNVLEAKGIVIKPRDNQVTWVAPDASTALLLLASNQSLPLGRSGGVATPHHDSEGDTK